MWSNKIRVKEDEVWHEGVRVWGCTTGIFIHKTVMKWTAKHRLCCRWGRT